MNFQQWQASIDDIKSKLKEKYQTEVIYGLQDDEFSFMLVETKDTFTSKLKISADERAEVAKFVEESDKAFKAMQKFKAVNSATSQVK